MNQKLLLKLNQLLASATPTKIVERGNAFAITEVIDKDSIKKKFGNYSFEGLNIYNAFSKGGTSFLEGECFFSYKNEELELEAEVQINDAANQISSFQLIVFEINKADNTMLLILKADST